MALKIDDIIGEGFSDSLDRLISSAKEKKRLTAAIDYSFFVREVLPYFLGEKEDPEFLAKWATFLGGANVEANIIKDGQILITIPPIVHKVKFKTGSHKIPAFAAFDDYSKMSLINPTVATNKLLEAVSTWFEEDSLEVLYENLKLWNVILEDTGRTPKDLSSLEILLGKRKLTDDAAPVETLQDSKDELFGDSW